MYGKMMGGKTKETASKGKKKGVPVTIMVAVGKPKMPIPMKGHQGYVRIDEPEVTTESVESETRTDTAFAPVIPTFKRMGRPRKVADV